MKKLSKQSDFYFPFSEGTTRQLFKNVFLPAIKGGNSLFYIGKYFGGGRAVSMFIIENIKYLSKRWNIDIDTDSIHFAFINPDELSEGSREGYLRLVLDKLGEKRGCSGRNIEYTELLGLVRDRLQRLTKKKNVVLVLRGLNYLDFGDLYFWANFSSMISGIDNLGVVFIAYDDGYNLTDKRFSRIQDLLIQNVARYNRLSDRDINYSINRWGYAFDKDFTAREKSVIRKISKGRPVLLKACSNILAISDSKNPEELLRKSAVVQKFLGSDRFDFRVGGVYFRGRNMTPMFSPQEYKVLRLLADRPGEIVSKDDIADKMWGRKAVQKYSESAISQLIKRLRDKFELLNLPRSTIKTSPTKGYLFVEG